MIADTNNIVTFIGNVFVGSTSGNPMFFVILFVATLAMALIYARAKASTSVAVMAGVAIMFSFIVDGLMFIWWLALIISLFVLINGVRKWITSQA